MTPAEVFVEADTTWQITASKRSYTGETRGDLRAPGPGELEVLDPFTVSWP